MSCEGSQILVDAEDQHVYGAFTGTIIFVHWQFSHAVLVDVIQCFQTQRKNIANAKRYDQVHPELTNYHTKIARVDAPLLQ